MKAILLHTARVDNSGTRRAAGETLRVGKGDDMITAEAAQDMIDRQLAVAAGSSGASTPAEPETVIAAEPLAEGGD